MQERRPCTPEEVAICEAVLAAVAEHGIGPMDFLDTYGIPMSEGLELAEKEGQTLREWMERFPSCPE